MYDYKLTSQVNNESLVMTIYAVLPGGSAYPIDASPDWTIDKLESMITLRFGLAFDTVCLLYEDEPLYGFFTIADYGIKAGDKLYIGIWFGKNLVVANS